MARIANVLIYVYDEGPPPRFEIEWSERESAENRLKIIEALETVKKELEDGGT